MITLGKDKYLLDSEKEIIWDQQNFPISNIHAIHNTFMGICELAYNTRKFELEKFKENDWTISGTALLETGTGKLNNYFAWFSISITNYLKLVSFVQFCNDNKLSLTDLSDSKIQSAINSHCSTYTKSIIPDIVNWRNKVGAHYSLTAPRKNDNIVSMINSVNSIGLGRSKSLCYSTGIATFHTGGTEGQDSNIPSWSLTKTYEDLSDRFFANYKLQKFSNYFDHENKPQQIDCIKTLQKFGPKVEKSKKRNLEKAKKCCDKGIAYSKQGEHEKAIREYEKSLFEHNGYINSWNNLGAAFWDSKKYHNARKVYEFIFLQNFETNFSKFMYGKILGFKFGKRKKAISIMATIPEDSTHYDKAMKIINYYEELSQI